MYLDVETHDYHEDDSPADPVQMTTILGEVESGKVHEVISCYVSRVGWAHYRGAAPPIAERVITIHGITEAMCAAHGRPPQMVLDDFRRALARADVVVAHNAKFDVSVVTHALAAMRLPPVSWPETFCTMTESSDILRIPGGRHLVRGYKAPRLAEAYRYFVGKEMTGAHDSLADTYACRAVHRGILRHRAREGGDPRP